ncbi:MAG: hypothetical protein HWN80_16475 [Candidatus Lokiarchaeota archaeon]|nr:hypothetical protein [Candidatus Lokiarchaeota archaeon]
MCFYITTTLPENTDIESIRTILDRYNMALSPIKNNNLSSQLRPGELYFRATKDYCDCDTSLGFLNREVEYQKLLNSKKVKTLRKKKWTESEIDEWIRMKLQNKPSHSKSSITQKERHLDIERWTNFILEIINSNEVSRIGILKHWYRYGLNDEEITLKRTVKSSIDEIKPKFLLNLEENVLYEFFPQYKS